MKLDVFLFLMLITGFILIFIHFATICPPKQLEYRYLTPSMEERMQNAAVENKRLFKVMFDEEGPWMKMNNSYTFPGQFPATGSS